jgi:hypothetical protein
VKSNETNESTELIEMVTKELVDNRIEWMAKIHLGMLSHKFMSNDHYANIPLLITEKMILQFIDDLGENKGNFTHNDIIFFYSWFYNEINKQVKQLEEDHGMDTGMWFHGYDYDLNYDYLDDIRFGQDN